MNIFVERLEELRKEKSLTQRQLSLKIGIPITTINGWIKRNRLPDYHALIKLCKFFDVSADYLLGLTDNY